MPEQEQDLQLARNAKLARNVKRLREEYGHLSEEELIAQLIPTPDHITAPMEMQRRLILSNRELRHALDAFAKSSTRAGWAPVAFTAVLVGLTIVLIVRG